VTSTRRVSDGPQLLAALDAGITDIVIDGTISGTAMLTLAPGVTLRGGTLRFGAKGIRLTTDNTLEDLTVLTADQEVAIHTDTTVATLGTTVLHNLHTTGQVLITAEHDLRRGHLVIDTLHVDRADLRGRPTRPRGFGVEALQGALTVWNRHPDRDSTLTADIRNVSAGSVDHPIRGSGVFVGGGSDSNGTPIGGTITVATMTTGEIHTDGGIPAGTPDLISGGVFVITGATVDAVVNEGPVTTYGQNDMVLDNWGTVTSWTALAPITSHGPSGIGFVNFGHLDHLDVQAPLTTHGVGARGFNLYDGTLRRADFADIVTTGDGAVGIQISRPMGALRITGNLRTSGSEGHSLVKGVQTRLKAIALSITHDGDVDTLVVDGEIATSGQDLTSVEIDGRLGRIHVNGGIHAAGNRSLAVRTTNEIPGLPDVATTQASGG
jgi:hypothetical protein